MAARQSKDRASQKIDSGAAFKGIAPAKASVRWHEIPQIKRVGIGMAANGLSARCNNQNSCSRHDGMRYNNKKSWPRLMAANGFSARCNNQNRWSRHDGMRYNNKKSWPGLMAANGFSTGCNNQNRWLSAIAANGFAQAKFGRPHTMAANGSVQAKLIMPECPERWQ